MENDKPKKLGFWVANLIIGIVSVIFSCFIGLWTLSVVGLFPYFFFVLLVLFILIPVFYRKNRKNGKFRLPMWLTRISFVLISLLYVFLPYIGSNFEHDEYFYIPKKLIYTYGVYSPNSSIDEMLPKHLPDECNDYKFKTQLGSIAQDYHPSVYLMFYTDKATMEQYEKNFDALSNVTEVSAECEKREFYSLDNTTFYYPKNFPNHAFSWLDDVHRKRFVDMPNAKLYIAGTYYTKGCLLDYDSGLVVYWT